jgi:hypothetical protein
MRIQDQAYRSDVASVKSNPRLARNVRTVLRAVDPRLMFIAAVKRASLEDSAQSVAEQAPRTVAQRIDFVVISDTEQDSSEEDE